MNKNTGDIVIVLDASGSMSVMGKEPVDSVNDFIKEQKSDDGSTVTLVTFNNRPQTIMNNVLLSSDECICVQYDEYVPSGLTALYDALGQTIRNKLDSTRRKNVIMVILTDGEENASQEYKKSDIQKLIHTAKSAHNWQFVYLGANQDAFKVGSGIGCTVNEGYTYTSNGLKESMSKCSAAVKTSKQSGKYMSTL